MAEQNLFEQLQGVLQDLKSFLDANATTIRPAIQALASLIPQIVDLLDLLIGLMNDLKTEVQNLDLSGIDDLDQVSQFTGQITTFLDTTKDLLPEQADTIEEIRSVANVVTGLPSLDELKAEILALIDAISAHLNSFKS